MVYQDAMTQDAMTNKKTRHNAGHDKTEGNGPKALQAQDRYIFHKKKTANYTTISNQIFDSGLSAEGQIVLIYLLSRPSNFEPRTKHIQNKYGWGRDKTQRVFSELKSLGFASYQTLSQGGKLHGKRWMIYEDPTQNPYFQKPHFRQTSRKPEKKVYGESGKYDQIHENGHTNKLTESLKIRFTGKNPISGKLTESLISRPSENSTVGKPGPLINTEVLINTDSLTNTKARNAREKKIEEDLKKDLEFYDWYWEQWEKKGYRRNQKTEALLLQLPEKEKKHIREHLPKYLAQDFRIKPIPQKYLSDQKWCNPIAEKPVKGKRRGIKPLEVDKNYQLKLTNPYTNKTTYQ